MTRTDIWTGDQKWHALRGYQDEYFRVAHDGCVTFVSAGLQEHIHYGDNLRHALSALHRKGFSLCKVLPNVLGPAHARKAVGLVQLLAGVQQRPKDILYEYGESPLRSRQHQPLLGNPVRTAQAKEILPQIG